MSLLTGLLASAAAAAAAAVLLAGCSTAPPTASPALSAPPVATAAPAPDPRTSSTDHFLKGKAFALSGETDCARLEFDAALETFRRRARPGDADDLEFARQLYELSLIHI